MSVIIGPIVVDICCVIYFQPVSDAAFCFEKCLAQGFHTRSPILSADIYKEGYPIALQIIV